MSAHQIMNRVNKSVLQPMVIAFAMAVTSNPVLADASYATKIKRALQAFWILNGDAIKKPQPVVQFNLYELIKASARRHGIDDHQLASIVIIESAGDPCAVSHKNAKGLGQLIDSTAASLGVKDSFEPRQNLDGAAKYYAMQLAAAKGDVELAAAAYNFGPKAMHTRYANWPRETKRYVLKFRRLNERFRYTDWRTHLPQNIPATNHATCLG